MGTNRYAYADGDPINKSDPNGHASEWESIFRGLLGDTGAMVKTVSTPNLMSQMGEVAAAQTQQAVEDSFEAVAEGVPKAIEIADRVSDRVAPLKGIGKSAVKQAVRYSLNSIKSRAPAYGYAILKDGKLDKVGITSIPPTVTKTLARAQRQVSRFTKQGSTAAYRVVAKFPNRKRALDWEQRVVNRFKEKTDDTMRGMRRPSPNGGSSDKPKNDPSSYKSIFGCCR